jgi:hypothetical protein
LNQNEGNKTLSDRKNTRIFSEAVLGIGRVSIKKAYQLVTDFMYQRKNAVSCAEG